MEWHLFEASGIELEYMLVDAKTLDVRPMADSVLALLNGGNVQSDAVCGPVTWSNELALHVLELKVSQPTKSLRKIAGYFEQAILGLGEHLDRCGLRLMPTAMHPWMLPQKEVVLWPHEYWEVYQAFDKIFDCRSHGWGNVQSVHLNLPFCGDDEFRRLHAAIRLVLPLLPALAASSPVIEGQFSGQADTRMSHYARHCQALQCLTGHLIPESIQSQSEYTQTILDPIEAAIAPFNAEGNLRAEFVNARGAIARFDRGSIELRVMDVQEYPGADVAICAAVTAVLRELVAESWSSFQQQFEAPTEMLAQVLTATTTLAEQAVIDDSQYLSLLGFTKDRMKASEIWDRLLDQARVHDRGLDNLFAPLRIISRDGTLSTRIVKALGDEVTPENLHDVYGQLADCLLRWEPFQP